MFPDVDAPNSPPVADAVEVLLLLPKRPPPDEVVFVFVVVLPKSPEPVPVPVVFAAPPKFAPKLKPEDLLLSAMVAISAVVWR